MLTVLQRRTRKRAPPTAADRRTRSAAVRGTSMCLCKNCIEAYTLQIFLRLKLSFQ